MSNQHNNSTTLGVGGPTSGEQGSTLTHETMAETGGSGGSQQTQPRNEEIAPRAPGASQATSTGNSQGQAEGAGTAATATARGPQDTRSQQASPGSTGLGTPETGGNQSEEDLAPPSNP